MADGLGFSEGSGATVSTDDAGAAGHVQIIKLAISADGSATVIPADATYGLDVDVTRVIPGVTATALGKAEDAAHTTGDTGVGFLTVRTDTPGALAGTTGDYEFAQSVAGAVRVRPSDGTTDVTVTATGGTHEGMAVALIDAAGDITSLLSPTTASYTPTLDTSAYGAGDCLDSTVFSFASVTVDSGAGYITRLTVIDDDDLDHATTEYDVHFFNASVTPATENAAHALSDADAGKYVGTISTSQSDYGWADHGNNKTCTVVPKPLPFKLASGTTLYAVGVVAAGTPTHTAPGLEFIIQVER